MLEGEEGFVDGDFDFLFVEGDDLVIVMDDVDGGEGCEGFGVGVEFVGVVEEKVFGDVVGVVVDEGFFEEFVEIVEGNVEG